MAKKLLLSFLPFLLTAATLLSAKDKPQVDGDTAYRNNCMRCHRELPNYKPGKEKTLLTHVRVATNLTDRDFQAILKYLTGSVASAEPEQPRVVELLADKDNVFKPKSITLKAGETVILRVTSHFGGEQSRDGYQHSITIKKLKSKGWDLFLKDGTQDFKVTAPAEAGSYEIICNVKCGKGHDDMKMKLIVTP